MDGAPLAYVDGEDAFCVAPSSKMSIVRLVNLREGQGIQCLFVQAQAKQYQSRVKQLHGCLNPKFSAWKTRLLSEIFQQLIVACLEHITRTVFVLVGKVGLGWSSGYAQMIQISSCRLQPITDFSERDTVGKLAKYHTHEVVPCIESFGMPICIVFFYNLFNYPSVDFCIICAKSVIFVIGVWLLFTLLAKVTCFPFANRTPFLFLFKFI